MAVAPKIQGLSSLCRTTWVLDCWQSGILQEGGLLRALTSHSLLTPRELPASTQEPPGPHPGIVPQTPCLRQFPQVPMVSMFTIRAPHESALRALTKDLLCT